MKQRILFVAVIFLLPTVCEARAGSATWWLLFPTGYAALDALDDSRDGSLSGSELKGIGVWFDKNSNGRSDRGEVQATTDFGIQAIRTQAGGSDHGMPMNEGGIVLKDGATCPTYDWIVSPVRSEGLSAGGTSRRFRKIVP